MAALTGSVLVGGCGDKPSEVMEIQTPGQQPGILKLYSDSVRIKVPDTAVIGLPTPVQITTYGGTCISNGHDEVSHEGLAVDISVFDNVIEPGPGEVCGLALKLLNHQVDLVLSEVGNASIRVHGRKVPGDMPLTVTMRLRVVQPQN